MVDLFWIIFWLLVAYGCCLGLCFACIGVDYDPHG